MHWRSTALCLIPIFVVSVDARAEESACSVALEKEKIVFKGAAEPIDGDTLWLGIHKIRLKGIEALEAGQTCTQNAQPILCFDKTFDEIKRLASSGEIRCDVERANFGKPAMDRNRYLAI